MFSNSIGVFFVSYKNRYKIINIFIFIQLDQPALGMPDRKYYLSSRNDTVLVAYEQYAVQVAVAFGADEATAMHDMKEIVDFEIQIANVTTCIIYIKYS